MKPTALFAAMIFAVCWQLAASIGLGQTIEAMPPVVVKTLPEAGRTDVAPGVVEMRVTFSKDMADGSWSWSAVWRDSVPEMIDKPHYDADHRTCIIKVKLEPGKTYSYWLNSEKFHNFRDTQGHPAVPYLLVLQTSTMTAAPTTQPARTENNDAAP